MDQLSWLSYPSWKNGAERLQAVINGSKRHHDRFWPEAAVELSIAGSQGRKIADCHEGLQPTLSGQSTAVKSERRGMLTENQGRRLSNFSLT